jgi:hypothetical protein
VRVLASRLTLAASSLSFDRAPLAGSGGAAFSSHETSSAATPSAVMLRLHGRSAEAKQFVLLGVIVERTSGG